MDKCLPAVSMLSLLTRVSYKNDDVWNSDEHYFEQHTI